MWDIVGETKMPIAAFDTLATYYIMDISNGLDVIPLMQKHRKEHPKQRVGASYGPATVKIVNSEPTKQPSETNGKNDQ
jgi:hypothetical protein